MELIRLLNKENEIGIFVPKKPFKKLEGKWHSDESLSKAKIYSYSAIRVPFSKFEWPIPITPMFFINLFRVFWNYKIVHMWTYFYINSFFTLLTSLFFPKRKVIMSCDTFPGYSFKSGRVIDSLFFIYTKLFGWMLFGIPKKIHLYGKSMIEYAKKAGVKEKKIVVVPTGVDIEKFSGAGALDRSELGVSNEDFVIVYAGLLVPRKGIDIMLKVVKRLEEGDVKLLLVGDGPKKKEYIDLAEKLEIRDKVKFLGWRKDIPNILKSADLLFLPSRGEGLPGIVMEAMAAGLPIVASDIPCVPDLVEDGKDGFLCRMNDIECFAEKIKNVNKEMGDKGAEKIKEFSWDKLIEDYKRLYV